MQVEVVQDDVVEQSSDAIVTGTGPDLRMESGIAGRLRREAGEELNRAALAAGPVEVGAVAVTEGDGLPVDWVVHAAVLDGAGDATDDSIRAATRNALAAADERGCSSIAVPTLGCGTTGFNLARGARIIIDAIQDYEPTSLADARLIATSDPEYRTVERAADELRNL